VTWFVYYLLPGLVTSATSIFVFNTIQMRIVRRITAAQTEELKRTWPVDGDATGGASRAGPDGPVGHPDLKR
jgi:hypothetical protein